MQRLLARMLRRLGLSRDAPPSGEAWVAFLDAVQDALNEAEQDRYTLERSLNISSDEMRSLYDEVKLSSETALASERDKLAKTVASLEAIMAATEEGILVVDPERSLGLHNARFAKLWNLQEHPLAPDDYTATSQHVRSAMRDPEEFSAGVERYYSDPLSVGNDEIELKDGRTFHRHTAPVRMGDGTVIGRGWFFRDVTESRRTMEDLWRSNRFLDSIVENIPDMVFVKHASDLRFVRLNRAGEDLLGYRREELLGKSDKDFFAPAEADAFVEKDRQVLASGAMLSVPEENISTRNGHRVLSTKKIPILDDEGSPIYLLGISRDITQLRQAAEELRQAKEAAEAAARGKADFLAKMSHELRTPLNAILGFSRILARSPSLSDAERSHTAFLVTAAEHMLSLVNNLLDFRRFERAEVCLTNLELEPVIREAVEYLRPLVDEKGIRLTLDIRAPRAVADPTYLLQALLNLISNAAKFTAAGGDVRIAAFELGDRVRLEVADTGIGIAEEDRPKLFTYFTQLTPNSTSGIKGSGIGLALAHHIVERLGGTLEVASRLGVGSTFSFELPAPGAAERREAD
jgi:PAS domain S-box-containing protein